MRKIWVKTALISFAIFLLVFALCGFLLSYIFANTAMTWDRMLWYYIFIGLFLVVVGALIVALIIREITLPISKLINATNQMTEGKYNEGQIDYRHADEIGELTHNFNIMQKAINDNIAKLKDIAQRQQLFISGLTHEIKTPLTSMMLHTDTLLTTNLTIEETKNSLKHLYEQCRWMEKLSQKLLMLLTAKENLTIQPIKTKKLFCDVSDSLKEVLQKRNTPLIIKCEIDSLNIDYDLIKSLLINLIDNASKASENGKEIKLKAYKEKSMRLDAEILSDIIEVSDCGHGIPKEEISHITEIFYMVDKSRSKKSGGSGLGLALVKCIADAHNAKLEIDSELSKGTTVKVIF